VGINQGKNDSYEKVRTTENDSKTAKGQIRNQNTSWNFPKFACEMKKRDPEENGPTIGMSKTKERERGGRKRRMESASEVPNEP
jgi:hypothetical protein